mmetsp:Transcript_15000/g.18299  ORF Transcript_15000/g.18299 Transcript_15000/m.18299 type:complete len:398 (-) Transcript_15000:1039-2232(-)
MATVQITVPHNADVGDMLTFSVGGRELEIPIPEGTKPGDVLEIQVGNDEIDEEKSTGSTDHNNYCGSNSNGNDEEFSILLDDDVGVILNIQSSCKKSTVTEEEEKEEGGISSDASEKKTPASESDGTYAMAWPAGIHLSKFISSPSFDKWSTKKKNVVEIGSGSGLVGIAFAANASMKVFKRKSDAKKIQLILTDMPTALPLIEHNINNNSGKISSIVQENIKVKPLVWGETKSLDDVISSFDSKKKIDLVLASDILYNTSKEIYQSLCKTISALLITKRCGDSSEEGEIILALRWRKPEEERYFFLEMQKTYQVDFELVLDGIKEGYDCNLDWKEFGNPLSEKSNMYFTNTFVNVEGESKALKDISETDMENMSDDEHDSFEARFIQIYCGRLRSA